jgi:hypothetical protein
MMNVTRRPSVTFRLALLCATAAAVWVGGCQTTTEKAPRGKSHTIVHGGSGGTGDRAVEYVNPVVVQERSSSSSKKKGSSSPTSLARRNEDPLDECAERLHSLCGPLLFYYLQNRRLPPTLQELPSDGPEPLPPLYCPESHKPYVYALKNAIPIDNPKGYIIVHDPVPAHDGVRWCVVVSPGESAADSLIVKSVGIREARFAVLRTRALAEQKEMERQQQEQPSQQSPPPPTTTTKSKG